MNLETGRIKSKKKVCMYFLVLCIDLYYYTIILFFKNLFYYYADVDCVATKDTVPNGVGMGEIHSGISPSINISRRETCDPVISMEGLTASWSMDNDKPMLSNISFSVDKVQ